MKRLEIGLIVLCMQVSAVLAQKPSITNDTYKNWRQLAHSDISDDGKYVLATTFKNFDGGFDLLLASTDGKYKRTFDNIQDPKFVFGGNYLSFTKGDSIVMLRLGTHAVQYLPITGNILFREKGKQWWIFYKEGSNLIKQDFITGKRECFRSVDRYWLSDNTTTLVYVSGRELIWVDVGSGKRKNISSSIPDDISFNPDGTKVAFAVVDQHKQRSIHYFSLNRDSAIQVLCASSPSIRAGFKLSDRSPSFSKDGKKLMVMLQKETAVMEPDTDIIAYNVDVWSYKDDRLQSAQLNPIFVNEAKNRQYAAMVDLDKPTLLLQQLEDEDSMIVGKIGSNHMLVRKITNRTESYWNESQVENVDVVSLENGERKHVATNSLKNPLRIVMSETDRFLVWFDWVARGYYSMDMFTGTKINMSPRIGDYFVDTLVNRGFPETAGAAGFLKGDEGYIVYDKYDIWQLDPRGLKKPVNLTGGYGRKNQRIIRLGIEAEGLISLTSGDSILLSVWDDVTKKNGFCKIKLGKSNDISLRCLDNLFYYSPGRFMGEPAPPVKAVNAQAYILTCQSVNKAPNLVFTKDFKKFDAMTTISPHAGYNWFTAELHHWRVSDSTIGTGILYKPENFDSTKSYPIIFNYYEHRSDEVHAFRNPEPTNGQLNIAWYASNGYLVFVPDNESPRGKNYWHATQTVETAAKYLMQFPWVNTRKMGLQGHSFGGYTTLLIAANSNMFAAAQATAGASDVMQIFGGIGFGDESLNAFVEHGQLNVGGPPWQFPELYVKNSPINNVHTIKTPLLLVHNKEDNIVPFFQSLEMFTSLRRLKKPCWLIQYDREGHTVGGETSKLDYAVRQQQFFNYYLKDMDPPVWMTDGVPATLKGIRSGLRIDTSGKKP